jgi:glutamate formiminotransferase
MGNGLLKHIKNYRKTLIVRLVSTEITSKYNAKISNGWVVGSISFNVLLGIFHFYGDITIAWKKLQIQACASGPCSL